MKTSETQTALIAALLECQKAFPLIEKTKNGQAGNRKFKYAPLEAIKAICDPILHSNGLVLTQGADGHILETRLDHVSGEWRETRMPVNEVHASDQAYGIEISYKRRYSYQAILGVVTEEDVDGNGRQKAAKPEADGSAGSFKHTPRGGIGDDLPEDWKTYLKDLADDCEGFVRDGKSMEALEAIEKDNLDDTQRIYLESQMDAQTRRSLKEAAQAQREKMKGNK